jgi:deferrochelatase/peroxidase EfeB
VVLLGHPTSTSVAVPVPDPPALGRNGTFAALRVLAQDVAGFRRFVAGAAAAEHVAPELVAAKMCGRWPNGVPLHLAKSAGDADAMRAAADAGTLDLNDFDFTDDEDGHFCPAGSHIRRANPRAAPIVQRPANRSRRLVRRGVPFGPWLPEGNDPVETRERGLLGNFLCASLSTQFEAMQYDWINLGLQDPSITTTHDPLVGASDPATSRFTWTDDDGPHTVRGLPRFVETMGGAYFFVPSLPALAWLGSAGWRG